MVEKNLERGLSNPKCIVKCVVKVNATLGFILEAHRNGIIFIKGAGGLSGVCHCYLGDRHILIGVEMLAGKFHDRMRTAHANRQQKRKTGFTHSTDVPVMHMQVPFVHVALFFTLFLFDHESPTCTSFHLKRSFDLRPRTCRRKQCTLCRKHCTSCWILVKKHRKNVCGGHKWEEEKLNNKQCGTAL